MEALMRPLMNLMRPLQRGMHSVGGTLFRGMSGLTLGTFADRVAAPGIPPLMNAPLCFFFRLQGPEAERQLRRPQTELRRSQADLRGAQARLWGSRGGPRDDGAPRVTHDGAPRAAHDGAPRATHDGAPRHDDDGRRHPRRLRLPLRPGVRVERPGPRELRVPFRS